MSNEQRAHDLAITIVSNLDLQPQEYFPEYKKYYFQALECFNRDFLQN